MADDLRGCEEPLCLFILLPHFLLVLLLLDSLELLGSPLLLFCLLLSSKALFLLLLFALFGLSSGLLASGVDKGVLGGFAAAHIADCAACLVDHGASGACPLDEGDFLHILSALRRLAFLLLLQSNDGLNCCSDALVLDFDERL